MAKWAEALGAAFQVSLLIDKSQFPLPLGLDTESAPKGVGRIHQIRTLLERSGGWGIVCTGEVSERVSWVSSPAQVSSDPSP